MDRIEDKNTKGYGRQGSSTVCRERIDTVDRMQQPLRATSREEGLPKEYLY
jgi:hypothetical protein